MRWQNVNWTRLAQYRDLWLVLVNTALDKMPGISCLHELLVPQGL